MYESMPNTFESEDANLNEKDSELWAKYIEDPQGYHASKVSPDRWLTNFESLINRFENKHNLEELHSIIELDPKEAPNHPIREPARVDLILIVHRMNFIRDHTRSTENKHQDLYEKYMILSRAVGMINNGVVDHTRRTGANKKY